jgi:starvation-inducible DNA-binding protein
MIDIGLQKKERKLLADALCGVFSDSYLLYVRLQGFSWNVTGENARILQELFVSFFDDQRIALDQMAKRVRSLGHYIPSTLGEFIKLSGLKEDHHHLNEAHDLVRRLVLDNEFLVRQAQEVYDLSVSANDPVTRFLMQERMRVHAENAWSLRIHLE